jgi:hypothetical protein
VEIVPLKLVPVELDPVYLYLVELDPEVFGPCEVRLCRVRP